LTKKSQISENAKSLQLEFVARAQWHMIVGFTQEKTESSVYGVEKQKKKDLPVGTSLTHGFREPCAQEKDDY
jgi:hypothetical protein